MQEVKFNYQNITAEVTAESVTVKNKNLFVNTDRFACVVTVAKDGKEIRPGRLTDGCGAALGTDLSTAVCKRDKGRRIHRDRLLPSESGHCLGKGRA